MNFIHIAGHLGADPEVRFTSNGKKVTTLRVACRTRKGKNDDTIWWRVTIWGEQYDKMIPYLKKGSAIMVGGEFHKPEIFTDREGKSQVSLEITAYYIQFSPFGKPGGGTTAGTSQEEGFSAGVAHQFSESAQDPYMQGIASMKGSTIDDEVPF
ncbi:MAG TPA: single-stranded DNA-binding protein [Chlamydiales bacterium]|nr:single-stranded DNA-binding protein [Chlamydiales bacterium]